MEQKNNQPKRNDSTPVQKQQPYIRKNYTWNTTKGKPNTGITQYTYQNHHKQNSEKETKTSHNKHNQKCNEKHKANQHKNATPVLETTQNATPDKERGKAHDQTSQEAYFGPTQLTFFDEDEERWEQVEETEKAHRERTRTLGKSPYAHPNDLNLQIYPEPRHYGSPTWKTDHIEMYFLDKEPQTTDEHNREKYAIRELGIP